MVEQKPQPGLLFIEGSGCADFVEAGKYGWLSLKAQWLAYE